MSTHPHSSYGIDMRAHFSPKTLRIYCVATLLLVSAAAFAAGCGRQPAKTVFLDPALVPLIPPDTVALAGIRMEKLQETPFWKKYLAENKFQPLERFRRNTGLDPARVWEILAASDGKGTVLLLRGKFSETGLEPRLQIEGARRFAHKGYTFTGDEEFAVVFLNPSTGAAGPTPMLRQILDRRGESNDAPAALKERINKISPMNQVWFVSHLGGRLTGPELPRGDGLWSNLGQLARSVQYISGGINLGHGFRMGAEVEASTDADARRVRDAVRALVGFARLNTAEDQRELLQLYDGINVVHEARMARIDVNVGPEQLDDVVSFLSHAPIFGGSQGR
jgi:hypothetical protein